MGAMDRRAFFRSAMNAAGRTLQTLVAGREADATDGGPDVAFWSDLTPELLALEAEKAGLDPDKDRDRIIANMCAAMGPPRDDNQMKR